MDAQRKGILIIIQVLTSLKQPESLLFCRLKKDVGNESTEATRGTAFGEKPMSDL
jgi:hypothetical protein